MDSAVSNLTGKSEGEVNDVNPENNRMPNEELRQFSGNSKGGISGGVAPVGNHPHGSDFEKI